VPTKKEKQPLSVTHPELAKEADGWESTEVTKGSHKKLQWKCKKNHVWIAAVNSRVLGRGCPVCSNKSVLVGVNDLATTHPHIAIEAFGWDPTTVTFGSSKRKTWKCANGHIWETTIGTRRKDGCAICSGRKVLPGLNDLQTTHPEIAKQASGWDPTLVSQKSGLRKEWRCELGHFWISTIATRTQDKDCPFCAGQKVWIGFNDLQTTQPKLALQALDWDPKAYTEKSGKKLSWKCEQGHIWQTRIISRTNGSGCPTCSPMQFDPNNVGYLYFLENRRLEMLQIGITNQPEKRLAKHARGGWEVIEVQKMDGLLVRNWETSILKMLRGSGVILGPLGIAGKFDGYSEAWNKSTFDVKSIKELMRLTEEFESEN
jgi:hypothetical protein